MNWRNTWLLVGIAAALFAFIYLYERHLQTSDRALAPERLLASYKAASASVVQLRRGSSFVMNLERTNGGWRYTAPFNYPASGASVDALLEVLDQMIPGTYITPQEMVARKQTTADFGFDAPTIVISLQSGSETPQILRFGSRTPANDQVYVMVDRPGIYVVNGSILDRLPRNQNAWRDPALVAMKEMRLDRIDVVVGAGGGFEARRDSTNKVWRLTKPSHRADQLRVVEFVKQLAETQIANFVLDDPKADLEPFGLQAPAAEVTIGSGTDVQRIQFGRSPTNDPALVYARQVFASNVVLVPKKTFELVATTPYEKLRDRRLLMFAPETVDAIEVRSEEPFTLTRQANGAWTMSDGAVDSAFVDLWMRDMANIDIKDFVKDVVTDWGAWGLAKPRLSVIVRTTTSGSATTNRIDFGTNDTPQTVLVRRADEDSVYSIRALEYLRAPAAAWQLRDHRVWTFTTNQVARVAVRQGDRTRQLLRQPNGQWVSTTGEIESVAAEEIMYALGELRARAWLGRGQTALATFGIEPGGYELTIDLKDGEKTRTLMIQFSARTGLPVPFAATTIDGQPLVFEFPWPLWLDLQRYLSAQPPRAGL